MTKTNKLWTLAALCAFALTGAACSQSDSNSATSGAAGTIVAAKRTAVADTDPALPAATDASSAADAAAAAGAKGDATATTTNQADAEAASNTVGDTKNGVGDKKRRQIRR